MESIACGLACGRSPHTGRSPISEGSPLASKITPLPIGLDLHTLANVADTPWGRDQRQSPSQQLRHLRQIRAASPPFGTRKLALLVPFACPGFYPDQHMACRWIDHRNGSLAVRLPRSSSRDSFWQSVGDYAFVASPQGHGMDTHRLWEVLLLGSVPVVVSSPLDALYAEFPVVILPSWQQLSELPP